MKIPKYVQELMSRSRYEYDFCTKHEDYAAGYTLRIQKHSEYAYAETLKAEVKRLCNWADKAAGAKTAHILSVPESTHYRKQYAIITIYDPVMQKLEQYIPRSADRLKGKQYGH